MTPRESYLSVKAHKSRQDQHYGQMAAFVATLYNAHGNKKKVKPKDLYEPNLARPSSKPEEGLDEAAKRRRKRERRERIQALEARHPVGSPPNKKR